MRFAMKMLPGILLLGSLAALNGQTAASSRVVIGFAGGSVWTSATTGTCVWYFPMLTGLEQRFLFTSPLFGSPVVDKEHAFFIWVSDFSVEMLPTKPPFAAPPNPLPADWPPYKLALVPTGTATVYFTTRPDLRDWSDLSKRSTWGEPVATFTRNQSVIHSPDNLASDNYIFTADLVSSTPVTWNGKSFNLGDVVPQGMTCFEFGKQGSSWEVGSCVAR